MVDARIVQSRTAREVEELADNARGILGLAPGDRVSMTPLLEQVLYDLIDDYEFIVEEDRVMGRLDGLTDCQLPIIRLRAGVYHALQRSDPRARMTAAHEFGHLLMHCGLPSYRAKTDVYQPLFDPERQANIFAAAFLMPREAFLRCRTIREAQRKFGVSMDAVMCRARKLRHRFEPDRPVLSISKKKGHDMRRAP